MRFKRHALEFRVLRLRLLQQVCVPKLMTRQINMHQHALGIGFGYSDAFWVRLWDHCGTVRAMCWDQGRSQRGLSPFEGCSGITDEVSGGVITGDHRVILVGVITVRAWTRWDRG